MPVDNRNFIIEDLPEDPEDSLFPEDDEPDDDLPVSDNNSWPFFGQNTSQPPFQQQTVQTPYYRPFNSTPWSSQPSNPPYFQQSSPIFNSSPVQPTPCSQQYQQTGQKVIDRRKKIIFCDILDILIESESAIKEQFSNRNVLSGNNNYRKSGIMPRALYDIRLKLEIWSKIAAFSPDYVFCVTNQSEMSSEGVKKWEIMTKFVMASLSEYLNVPLSHCRCLTKIGFDRSDKDVKPGVGLLKKALNLLKEADYKYCRKDLVVLGINSGYSNQSNIDKIMAKNAGIDYVDVNDLLTQYY